MHGSGRSKSTTGTGAGRFQSPSDSFGENTFATSQSVEALLRSWLPVARAADQVCATVGSTPSVSTTTPTAAGTMTISGNGFLPGTSLTIVLHSDPVVLATVDADANGAYSVIVTIPAGTTPGTHQIVVSGLGPDGQPRESARDDRGAGRRAARIRGTGHPGTRRRRAVRSRTGRPGAGRSGAGRPGAGRPGHGRIRRERAAAVHRMKRVARVVVAVAALVAAVATGAARAPVAAAAGDSTAVVVIDTGAERPVGGDPLRRHDQRLPGPAARGREPGDVRVPGRGCRGLRPRRRGQPGGSVVPDRPARRVLGVLRRARRIDELDVLAWLRLHQHRLRR